MQYKLKIDTYTIKDDAYDFEVNAPFEKSLIPLK